MHWSPTFRRSALALLDATLLVFGACSEDPGTTPDNDGPNQVQNDGPDSELELTIVSGPDELTNETSAEFELSCNRDDSCDFSCRLNDGDMDDCDAAVTFDDLASDSHLFTAVAEDAYGNTSDPQNWTWTVDTEPPVIEDLTGPPEVTGQTDATFEFGCSKDDCSYECSLDDDPYESCQPNISYGDLDDGHYVFSVRATDAAGNTGDPANYEWTVDTESPLVVDLVGPDDPTNQTSATFEFGCSEDDCAFSANSAVPTRGRSVRNHPVNPASNSPISMTTTTPFPPTQSAPPTSRDRR